MKSIVKVKHFSYVTCANYINHHALKKELYDVLMENEKNTEIEKCEWVPTTFDVDTREVDALKQHIKYIIHRTYGWVEGRPLECGNTHVNIYRKGHCAPSHDHMPEHFTFVYFLKCEGNSSPLVFDVSGRKIPPKEGMMVIFPAYLRHSVPTYRSNEDRITIVGDVSVVMEPIDESGSTLVNGNPSKKIVLEKNEEELGAIPSR